jgi:uncharacterized membrane protein
MDTLSMQMTLLPLVWPLLLIGLFLLAVPDLMRPGLFFGVTVDLQFRQSELGRGIRRRYSIAICIATLIAIAVAVTAAFAATGAAWAPPALAAFITHAGLPQRPWALPLLVALCAFVWANRATRPHATQRASVVHVELPTRPEPTAAVAAAFAVPIASLVVLGVWIASHWGDIPSRLAVHWNFAGPDRWVSTTPATVTALLGVDAVICLFLALLGWGVFHGSRRIATSGEAAQRERRFRRRIVTLLLAAEYLIVFPAWGSLLGISATAMMLWRLITPATLLVLGARLLLSGQGGSRGLAPSSGAPLGDRTDDRYWVWGLIYFNRADPAFLVEKRFGVGYTFNFAHPFAWALLALIAASPLICMVL